MEKVLQGAVDSDALIQWLLIAFLVGYFIYKEWPEFQRRVSKKATMEETGKSIVDRIATIEESVHGLNEKLDRDYRRINEIEKELARHRRSQKRDREEMEIIMRGVLAALQGLQQQGCNGTVSTTVDEINTYLNKLAHEAPTEEWGD